MNYNVFSFSLYLSKHNKKRRNQNQTLQKHDTNTFFASKEEKTDFKNILNANVQPENDQNIFFVETGNSKTNVKLSARQCCSIESAALRNPKKRIFVLFVSRDRLNNLEITSQIKAILSYRNIQINYLNIEELSKESPIENFIKSKKLPKSKFRLPHTSDVLRLLILWMYGGTYLDMDMMVNLKKFQIFKKKRLISFFTTIFRS